MSAAPVPPVPPASSVAAMTAITAAQAAQAVTASAAAADIAWRAVHAAACVPYRQAGRFAWHWARGKLGRDPVFRGMLERGELPASASLVDIGCGQGLVASLLMACMAAQRAGQWPLAWPVQSSALAYTGIELMASDVQRGRQALERVQAPPFGVQFVCGDMRQVALPACNVVLILDVLHYVDHAAQVQVLQRVQAALRAGQGDVRRLLLRVGDAANTRGFAISQWVDRVVTGVRGHRVPPTWGRTLPEWQALLQGLGFVVECIPQSQGTPFANVLMVADLGLEARDAHEAHPAHPAHEGQE